MRAVSLGERIRATDEAVLLPVGLTVIDVAQGARRALIAFLDLDPRAVDGAALAIWLKGPYRSALSLASRSTLPPPSSVPRSSSTSAEDAPAEPEAMVRANVSAARKAIEKVLVAFLRKPDLSIGPDMVRAGLVQRIRDDDGREGYGPLMPKLTHLPVRVLSLAIADMLTRPDDLRAALTLEKGTITFLTRHVSAIVPRRRTSPYFGEG